MTTSFAVVGARPAMSRSDDSCRLVSNEKPSADLPPAIAFPSRSTNWA
jgi:hypothetical protein